MKATEEINTRSSFISRLHEGEWWQTNHELLNLQDINQCPLYYNGTDKDWIEEITTYIFLNPHEWDALYKEYLQTVPGNGNPELKFYRNEEGYLRLTETREIYLKIAGEGEPLPYTVLDSIGQTLSGQDGELFYSYLEYDGMEDGDKKLWMKHMKDNIEKRIGKHITVTFADSLEESNFTGNELYIDPLNDLYIIL